MSTWCIRGMTALCMAFSAAAVAEPVSLQDYVLIWPKDQAVTAKAASLLQDEIYKRTAIRIRFADAVPEDGGAIVLGTAESVPTEAPANAPEVPGDGDAYALWVDTEPYLPNVYVVGHDERGALFGAGRLLLELSMRLGECTIDDEIRVATAPAYPIRGHQVGYRHTANSYDAWDVATYEQFLRDMIVFGTNAVELIPANDPYDIESPHMPGPMWDMIPELTELIGSYGLDVWIWLPIQGDVENAEEAEAELAYQRALFESCAPIDAVFVPGGDPGDTPPHILMPFLARTAALLQEIHPGATLWVSNQGFEHEQNDFLFEYLRTEQPKWLDGLVFGPWAKISLPEMRERTPAAYPIRRYPDITHCVRCQYPMPDWDPAFAHTQGREPYNPRPVGMAHIHNVFAPLSAGFVTYSDGVHDDVNKFIWSALGWDPEADVRDILTDYGRYFIGEDMGEAVAEGMYLFEKSWTGPILENGHIGEALEHWKALEARGGAAMGNWRFQMALLRAYYDEYIRLRVQQERDTLEAVYAALEARAANPNQAVEAALRVIEQAEANPVDPALRQKIVGLADALWHSIGMQYTVEGTFARNSERGAIIDTIDSAVTELPWVKGRLEEVPLESPEATRKATIEMILGYEDPGPGGFYDDLGHVGKQPHLVRDTPWEADPGYVHSVQDGFMRAEPDARLSWLDQAETLFGTPLKMRYEGLDRGASYTLKVVYTGRYRATMTLTADGAHEVHGPVAQPATPGPMTFAIPREATADGVLELEWNLVEGRGCQVGEVWLMKAP